MEKVYEGIGELIDWNDIRPSHGGKDYTFKVRLDDGTVAFEPAEREEEFLEIKDRLYEEGKAGGVGGTVFMYNGAIGDRVRAKYIKYKGQNLLVEMFWEHPKDHIP